MTNHSGVLMMQRLLLAGTLGLAVAQRAAAILDGDPNQRLAMQPPDQQLVTATSPAGDDPQTHDEQSHDPQSHDPQSHDPQSHDPQSHDGAVLRAILDAANECLGHFDDRPAAERWCDALLALLDLAAFAADLDSALPDNPSAG